MKRFSLIFISLFVIACAWAQNPLSVRIERESPENIVGRAIATWDGRSVIVSNNAIRAWWIGGMEMIVFYSSSDGAGGYENEGQSLWRYDLTTGARRKLVTEYFVINKVAPVLSGRGRRVLLVSMADGGLGAPHAAIADPIRGEVWRHRQARFIGVRNGRVAIGIYRVSDIESGRLSRPYRILYLDLDTILRRPASPYRPVLDR